MALAQSDLFCDYFKPFNLHNVCERIIREHYAYERKFTVLSLRSPNKTLNLVILRRCLPEDDKEAKAPSTLMRFRLKTHTFLSVFAFRPSTLIRSKTEVYVCENGGFRKRSLEWRFLKTEVFENGGSASLCGRAKTEVFENDYVTGIGMSQLKNENGCFLIRFRWSSVKTLQKR